MAFFAQRPLQTSLIKPNNHVRAGQKLSLYLSNYKTDEKTVLHQRRVGIFEAEGFRNAQTDHQCRSDNDCDSI